MNATVEIQLVIAATGIACSIPGTYLLLRRMTMLTDAITHAVLPGIVIGFLWTHDLTSPLLIAGAALAGLLTVWLVELLFSSGNLRQDAAIGLVFPALFAIGVLLITLYASDVHLDIDAVLTGEPALLPFDRLVLHGVDLGPRALWPILGALLFNAAFVGVCAHPLKLTAFDAQLAAVMGLAPGALTYLLMTATAITAVAAFDAVGSVLVVALFTAPAATAWLLSDRLIVVQLLAPLVAVLAGVLGVQSAILLDVSIAGMVAVACGVLFAISVLFAPARGLVPRALRFRRARLQTGVDLLLVHLLHHGDEPSETKLGTLHEHFSWPQRHMERIIAGAAGAGLVRRYDDRLGLTEPGHERAVRLVQGRGAAAA